MGDETISSDTISDAQALAELEAEFERELKRNQLALQLLRERAEEAKIAKSRAELSAQKKECMMNKLKEMELNVALTNDTLTKAQERIDKQDEIRSMVDTMKDKIKNYEVKLNKQKQNSQQLGILGECNPDFDFPTPLIDYDEEEKKETQQNVETQIDQKLSSTKEDKKNRRFNTTSKDPLLWGFVCNFRQFQQEADASVKTDENRLCPNGSRFTRKIVPRNCRSGNGNAVIDKKSRQITTRGFKPNCINFIRFIKKSRQTRWRQT